MRWLLGSLLLAALALLGLRLYLSRDAENRVRTGEIADFAHLEFAHRENVYLICPSEPPICNQPADAASPFFPLDVAGLRQALLRALSSEPRLSLVEDDEAHDRLIFIQRSWLLRFPDVITVELVPLADGKSTLAMLSRSRYGRKDFGVNAERLGRWLAKLSAAVGP